MYGAKRHKFVCIPLLSLRGGQGRDRSVRRRRVDLCVLCWCLCPWWMEYLSACCSISKTTPILFELQQHTHRCMTSFHLHSLYIHTDRRTLPFYPRLGEASKGKITITFQFFGTKLTVKQERQGEYLSCVCTVWMLRSTSRGNNKNTAPSFITCTHTHTYIYYCRHGHC